MRQWHKVYHGSQEKQQSWIDIRRGKIAVVEML